MLLYLLHKKGVIDEKSIKEAHGEHQIWRTYVIVLESTMKTPYQNNKDKMSFES